jgi:hypothetical protein
MPCGDGFLRSSAAFDEDEHAGQQRLIDQGWGLCELVVSLCFIPCLFFVSMAVCPFFFLFHESNGVKQKKLHPLFVAQSLLTHFELATVTLLPPPLLFPKSLQDLD